MKRFKKIVAVALAAVMTASLAGCGNTNGSSVQAGGSSGDKAITIGVAQLMTHPAMDAALKGFKDALQAEGFEEGKNINYDIQNAQGDQANCITIANTFANKKPDLILAIATPVAQSVVKVITDTPVLVTAVTDPAEAKLVKDNQAPGANVSGTSDKTPVKQQMELLKEIAPQAKTIGLMYTSSETNSQIQIKWAKEVCDEIGLGYQEFTISNSNEIQQVAQSMVGKVDAVYIPTDNMLASGMKTVSAVVTGAKLPLIVGEVGPVENGGLCTVGINYEKLGYQTGLMAAKVLRGEAQIGEMPIEYQEDYDISYNGEVAKQLGITLPDRILAGEDVSAR
ncbi:ABC transporter substrate-binding protein [Clostridium minihomine]|uniref:ABC transporter substrate-binding protein n=1 Tax=Clostridium minihomine TaxID=2045012 RepID=UPI000C75733A|nr:ABC transporter substrate-binding protein [Clostridium minihomine]